MNPPSPALRGSGLRVHRHVGVGLSDIVQLTAAPLFGGLPKLTDARGRSALASMAGGKVRIAGSVALARRLLKLMEI